MSLYRRLPGTALFVVLCLANAIALFAQNEPSVVVNVVDRGNFDAPVASADVRVLIGGALVDEGITNARGQFSTSVPQIGQTVTIESKKVTYVRSPETTQVIVRQRPMTVEAALARENADKAYYARLGDRIEQITAQQPATERERVKSEEFARVLALSPEYRVLVAESLSVDLQTELHQIGAAKDELKFTNPFVDPGSLGGVNIKDSVIGTVPGGRENSIPATK